MNFEKVLNAIASLDLQDEVLNFLDIKTPLLNQKLKAIFEDISNFYFIKKNFIFDLVTKNFENINYKVVFSKKMEIQDIELFGKIVTIESSNLSKFLQTKVLVSKFSNDKTKCFNEKALNQNTKTALKIKLNLSSISKNFDNREKNINQKLVFYLKDVKLVSQKFNKMFSFNEKKTINSTFSKILENKPIENTIKLNLKLFNIAFSQALKGSFDIFHSRQIIQPPFGIIVFYIKEKERKRRSTKNKKRKSYYIPNLKLKKENSNKNFK